MGSTTGTPSETSVARETRALLGILFMCAAGTLLPIMNGLVQVLSRDYPSEQIIWARTASHLLLVLLFLVPRLGWRVVRTVRPGLQVGRSILLLMSTGLFFFGVKHVPLAKAASVSLMAPLFVTLLAWPLLGEPIRLSRLLAVLAGFLGVIVVIRPGSEVFHWASILLLGSAACYGLYQVFTRRVAGFDRPETSVIYSALVGTVVMSFVVPFAWKAPETLGDAALLASLGVLGAGGHYCVARAMTYAPANVVSPFQYWQMVGSIVVGYIISGMLPDLATWIGAAIIVSSGVYIALTVRSPARLAPRG